MTAAERDYDYFKSTEKFGRMLEDDDFYDVTEEDVAKLLDLMGRACRPRSEIIKVRRKYDRFLHDKEKQFMVRLGLNYNDHVIKRRPNSPVTFLVNGYTEKEWLMLTDEGFFPPYRTLTKILRKFEREGKQEDVRILRMKYSEYMDDRDQQILMRHNIPLDTKYTTLTPYRIDGRSFVLWHLLNDDEFVPRKSVLISVLWSARKRGRDEDANALENKYSSILFPQQNEKITEDDINEAEDFFSDYHI